MVTGFGAPAAGAPLGALAGVMGAIVAAHNIKERADRKTLEFDAELVMDILAIVGVAELAATARLASLQRAVRGFQAYERVGKFIAVYRLTAEGASAVLIPLKLKDDLGKIDALDLPVDVKRRMIQEAWEGAGMGLRRRSRCPPRRGSWPRRRTGAPGRRGLRRRETAGGAGVA